MITLSGIGLHTGLACQLKLLQMSDPGFYFQIMDDPIFHLRPELAEGSAKGTLIHGPSLTGFGHAGGSHDLTTVEHLLSACAGTGRWGMEFTMSAVEPPILDGSALPFVEAIKQLPQTAAEPIVLKFPVCVQEGDAFIAAVPLTLVPLTPSPLSRGRGVGGEGQVRIRYYASYPTIGDFFYDFGGGIDEYVSEIAPARTFCMDYEIEIQRKAGLIKGASLDCAVVFSKDGPSTPLRFQDEPVRHKILDFIGDLAILGRPLLADIVAVKTSHKLNIAFAQKVATLT